MPENKRISALLDAFLTGTLNDQEQEEWRLLVQDAEQEVKIRMALEDKIREESAETYNAERFDPMFERVISIDKPSKGVLPSGGVVFLKSSWFRYVAAALVILAVGAYLWRDRPVRSTTGPTESVRVINDLPPGNNKAVLTLSSGKKIILLESQGALKDGNVRIDNADGELVYKSDGGGSQENATFNTMTTPRGGQYKLSLPDGTKVWLNASSSITFPTAFTGSERRVTITGEAYFEVAYNAANPFFVQVNDMEVRVLGTHFNINSYVDEEVVKTTLLEGSVRVTVTDTKDGNNRQTVVLKQGQAAQISGSGSNKKISMLADVDLEQTVAWKNGITSFKNADIKAVMRQVARWYDVDIVYEGVMPAATFSGEVSRQANVSKALSILDYAGIRCRIEGKKIVVQL